MARAVATIEAMPSMARNAGWQNQLAHGKKRLINIEKALATKPGTQPFPDGPDLFQPMEDKLGSTMLDSRKIRRVDA